LLSERTVIHDVSPPSRLVAFADATRMLALWQPGAANDSRRFFDDYPSPAVAAHSPDGRYLAVGDKAGVVTLLRLAEHGRDTLKVNKAAPETVSGVAETS
jgi:hypothetical protein